LSPGELWEHHLHEGRAPGILQIWLAFLRAFEALSFMKDFFAGRLLAKPLAAGEIAFMPLRAESMG